MCNRCLNSFQLTGVWCKGDTETEIAFAAVFLILYLGDHGIEAPPNGRAVFQKYWVIVNKILQPAQYDKTGHGAWPICPFPPVFAYRRSLEHGDLISVRLGRVKSNTAINTQNSCQVIYGCFLVYTLINVMDFCSVDQAV